MAHDQTHILLRFNKRLASAPDQPAVERNAVAAIEEYLGLPAVILAPVGERLDVKCRSDSATPLSPAEHAAAEKACASREVRECRAGDRGWRFIPLVQDQVCHGTLALQMTGPEPGAVLPGTIDAFASQLTLALVRVQLVARLEQSRLSAETERLRAALLSSVSHDLRTPLSAMIGAASSVRELDATLSDEQKKELLDSVLSEGQRLDRYIQNLLDMTKLGHGTLQIARDWIAVSDIVSAAVRRLRPMLREIEVIRTLPLDLPLLYVHPALIEQALVNVLENAARFSPPGATIHITAHRTERELALSVTDRGPGIPEKDKSRVFDMFFTGGEGDRGAHGSGLGLAICHGMVGAHGGRVEARAGADGCGTTIVMSLPLASRPINRPPAEAS